MNIFTVGVTFASFTGFYFNIENGMRECTFLGRYNRFLWERPFECSGCLEGNCDGTNGLWRLIVCAELSGTVAACQNKSLQRHQLSCLSRPGATNTPTQEWQGTRPLKHTKKRSAKKPRSNTIRELGMSHHHIKDLLWHNFVMVKRAPE